MYIDQKLRVIFMEQLRSKRYVSVNADHDIDGSVWPKTVTIRGGKTYTVQYVKKVINVNNHNFGNVIKRYTVMILDQETYIFEDNGRWFVEYKEGTARA